MRPLPADCVYFGEISLSGAIRPVAHAPARLKEAQKLGFAPGRAARAAASGEGPVAAGLRGVAQLVDLVAGIAATARGARRMAAERSETSALSTARC